MSDETDNEIGSPNVYQQERMQTEYSSVVHKTIRGYLITTVLSIVLAVVSIGYNAWRLVQSEENANVRNAAFQTLITVAEFQQIIYAAHYDKLEVEGSPRRGWVKILLAEDLSVLVGPNVSSQATELRKIWASKMVSRT